MSEWKYFSHSELKCRCGCGDMKMQDDFMRKMVVLRSMYGKPMHVSSAYRCPAHNISVSQSGITGPHTTGRAIDIRAYGADAFRILQLVMESYAFTGIGISQRNHQGSRFIHIDDLDGETRPWVWSY